MERSDPRGAAINLKAALVDNIGEPVVMEELFQHHFDEKIESSF